MLSKGTIGAAVMIVMLVACTDSSEPASTTAPPLLTTVTTTVAPATTISTTTVPPSTTTTTTASEDEDLPWDVWTLIYASLDSNVHAREDAETIAAGIDGAGVLLSDEYPSLNPGYWVVYAGEWHDRQLASVWCPRPLDPDLSCYPRYLGANVVDLVANGAAIVQLAEKLVVMDPDSGETLVTFSDNFHSEAVFPARFTLNEREDELYFSLGFEDSWYSCDSDKGQIRRLDLDSGTEDIFADGWSPAISPDGRWLAVVAAQDCYPDPEVDGWVITPGSQVEIYDLSKDGSAPSFLLRPETPPTSYEDEHQVLAVFWDPAVPGDLLVALADNSVRRIAYDSREYLDDARVEFATGDPYLAAITAESQYFLNYYDELFVVTEVDRASGEVVATWELDGWWTSLAVNSQDEVLIGASGLLILPSGEEVVIDGDIHNLAW